MANKRKPVAKRQPRLVTKTPQGYVMSSAGYELVGALLEDGYPLKFVARTLGMDPKTFKTLRNRDERLEGVVQKAQGAAEQELVDLLMQQARNGNTVAALFLLKTRHGYREGGPANTDAPAQVQITIPPSMTPEQFERLVQASPAPQSDPMIIEGTASDV